MAIQAIRVTLNWDKLKILGDLTVYEYTKNQTENVVERLQDCEIALTNKTVITKEIMEACPKLRYIGVLATGYNVVDMKAAAERGITVTNVPGYSTQAVAQQAFALLLEICSHVAHHSSEVHSGRWSRGRDFCFWDYPLVELDHKTAGIIGFGQTGKAIGRVAKAFGMRVITCGSHATEEGKAIGEYVAREQLLRESDVIFLACPLNEGDKGSDLCGDDRADEGWRDPDQYEPWRYDRGEGSGAGVKEREDLWCGCGRRICGTGTAGQSAAFLR